ncbi:beta strand repeat-containing protein [Nostoc sp.]|uniref:Calcium-binding protein n=1 Tax=Nostoc punctiforme NIES-2108 TaxID=1356359 RepID=A0A367R7R8_NOSPU|nr:hypothetical protein A6769_27855 [Nostoc punctiforme NIES-2108]
MSRLIVSLSPFIGTSGSDLVVGQEDNALLPTIPAIGIEVLKNGVIDTQAGKDTISGTGTGGGNGFDASTGTGITNSGIINAGSGDDTISGTGSGGSGYRSNEPGTGISNTQSGYINGGDGKDLIEGTGTGGDGNIGAITIGIQNTQNSRIDGGFGNDSIEGTGSGTNAIGISNTEGSNINGGEGNDSIKGTGTGGISSTGGEGTGIFNSGGSNINGEKGNDSIVGIGNGSDAYLEPFRSYDAGRGIGISNSKGSTIAVGQGNDYLSGTGTGGEGIYADNPFGNGPEELASGVGIGIVNSGTINLGDGNDTLIGTGISQGTGILNTDGIICEGAGADILTGYGTSVGIQGGTIDGGNGNDKFKARRIDANGNTVLDLGGAIADVLIKGGGGDDIFDVGYGNATLDGGSGSDKLILSDFKSDYIITGTGSPNNYTIKRDQFTLNVLNVEEIAFSGVPLQQNVLGTVN